MYAEVVTFGGHKPKALDYPGFPKDGSWWKNSFTHLDKAVYARLNIAWKQLMSV